MLAEMCEVLEVLLGGPHLPEPLSDPTSYHSGCRKNKLIVSNRAGASLNKSPREAKLLDQCDAGRMRLSLMIDGLIIHVF